MNQGRCLRLLALSCLLLVAASHAAACRAADPDGALLRTRLHYAGSAHLDSPVLHSSAALVLDVTHSTVLYARRSDVAMPIASITKLMTALVVTEAGQSLDEIITITPEDRWAGKGGFSRLLLGTHLTRGDLMHLALMASENRAAHALARNYPGGVEACVAAMNAEARELGMTSAHFVEPTGLSDENVASAEDLSKLVIAAGKIAAIREYSTDSHYDVRVGRRLLRFSSTDALTSKADWDIVVQKTGYISEAGRCLVMQAVFDDRSFVIVLLNSYGKRTRVADARRVRRWVESRQQVARATPAPATT
jgi:serine-type D-Ala-D-Ala endopeptidase (penicillin-binding protein 7)